MRIKKIIYIIIGCVGVMLGAIGAAIPLLPTFPFLMLAAFCFARSSEKLNQWFIHTKLYQKNFESFVKGQGMPWKSKLKIMIFVTITMSIGFAMMGNAPLGRALLAMVWVFHILFFIFGIKTKAISEKE